MGHLATLSDADADCGLTPPGLCVKTRFLNVLLNVLGKWLTTKNHQP
jgi:hypothetical protein